jgi:fructose-bisphosphate aldolase class II
MASFPQNNRTYQILDAAAKGNYAVGAYNWFVTPERLFKAKKKGS